tara:strand:- start:1083 stop:1796 length:714 start_codon:yes stop_codon:yes gene_type:complete
MDMNKVKNVVIIIVVIIVIIIVYRYLKGLSDKAYVRSNDDKTFYSYPSNAMTMKKIDNKDLPKAINNEMYSLGFWFYVDDWTYKYQQHKQILNKGDDMHHQPYISLDRTKNILKIKVDILDRTEDIEIRDIYMKQWVHVYMNVENININVYVNGKLAKSHILSSDIKNNGGDMYVNASGGFSGFITKLIVSNNVKTQRDIQKIYDQGPYNTSLLGALAHFFNKLLSKLSDKLDICNR